MTNVDLRELAIDRSGTSQPSIPTRRHMLTRYVLPVAMILGFLSLVAWTARDILFPPRAVTVVPVFSTHAAVRQEGTPLFNAAGWIEPRPTPVRVAALAPGVVEELLVVEDQAVKAGDPIAELIKDDAKLTYDAALADLRLREAELDEARSNFVAADTRLKQPVHLEAALGEAEASLAQIATQVKNLPFEIRRAEADQRAAQKDYDSKLAAKGVVAGVEVDIAKSKAESANALVEELRDRANSLATEMAAKTQRRDALQTQLNLLADEMKAKDGAAAQVKGATARVEQARVAVAEAKLRLDRMTVRSPIDGRVYRLLGHPGTRIGSGMERMAGHDGSTIVTLYRPDMLQVRVDVRFEDLPKVSLNQPVEIGNPALPSPLTGKVLFISSEADIQKNTLQVKVKIPNPPAVFKPEMLVDVTFLSPQGPESSDKNQETTARIFAPERLIHHDDDVSFVWLADQSASVARKRGVRLGRTIESGLVEVIEGLTISSRLITSDSETLSDGCRIRITGEDPIIGVSATTSGS